MKVGRRQWLGLGFLGLLAGGVWLMSKAPTPDNVGLFDDDQPDTTSDSPVTPSMASGAQRSQSVVESASPVGGLQLDAVPDERGVYHVVNGSA